MREIPRGNTTLEKYCVVVMTLAPLFYGNSEILTAVQWEQPKHLPFSDDPYAILNEPEYGQDENLENLLSDEIARFADDIKFMTKQAGYTVTQAEQTVSAKKYQYDILLEKGATHCCQLCFDVSVSDRTLLKMAFSEEKKETIKAALSMDKLLSGATWEAGIDLRVESVAVNDITYPSWSDALNKIYEWIGNN